MTESHPRTHLSGGAIAGIVVAVVVLVSFLIAAAFFLDRKIRIAKSRPHTQFPVSSSSVQPHENESTPAPQFPNPTIRHLSDGAVEHVYLRDAASVGNGRLDTQDMFGGANGRSAMTGKLARLTGDIPQTSIGRTHGFKPADERRSVPYGPQDFA